MRGSGANSAVAQRGETRLGDNGDGTLVVAAAHRDVRWSRRPHDVHAVNSAASNSSGGGGGSGARAGGGAVSESPAAVAARAVHDLCVGGFLEIVGAPHAEALRVRYIPDAVVERAVRRQLPASDTQVCAQLAPEFDASRVRDAISSLMRDGRARRAPAAADGATLVASSRTTTSAPR